MWWIHLIRDALPSAFRYTLSKSSECSVVGLLDRAHIYAAPIRVTWRAILYEYVFRSSTTHTLGTILLRSFFFLIRVCIVAHVAPDTTRCDILYLSTSTGNPYWPVASVGRKHADEHAWLCLTSHTRVIFAVHLWYCCSMVIRVFVMLCCL